MEQILQNHPILCQAQRRRKPQTPLGAAVQYGLRTGDIRTLEAILRIAIEKQVPLAPFEPLSLAALHANLGVRTTFFFFPLLPQLLGASDQAAPHVIQILECLLVSGLDPSITTLYFRDHSNQ